MATKDVPPVIYFLQLGPILCIYHLPIKLSCYEYIKGQNSQNLAVTGDTLPVTAQRHASLIFQALVLIFLLRYGLMEFRLALNSLYSTGWS